MKLFSSFLLVTALLIHILGNTITYIDFSLNKKYIAENLCENKNKPSRHCNGHCFLKKQLAMQDKNEQTPSGQSYSNLEIQLFHSIPLFSFNPLISFTIIPFNYLEPFSRIIKNDILRPPLN